MQTRPAAKAGILDGFMRLDTLSERDLPVTIGRYTLTGILGEGGMARVFRAKMEGALGFRKPAAVKVVLPAMGSKSEGLRNQLIQEARLGGLLNHPNVVQTFDCGELEGYPYIAMELVEGCGLDDLVQEAGPLPPAALLDVALQIARGLHHAHVAMHEGQPLKIIHRDVKPSNVLLREDGVVKVMDFGIAKVQMADALSTATGMTKGTPSYMSPEQLAADPLDGRTDLFALGAVLYYALTGKTLFTGSSLTEVMLRIIQVDETLRNSGVLGQVDQLLPGFGAVLGRLLVKDPAERYADAGLLERDLLALRRRYPEGDKALAGLVKQHFGAALETARHAAASVTGPSAFRGQGSEELRAAGAEETPGATRSFPASSGPGTNSAVGPAELPHTVGLMPATGDDWLRGTVDDDVGPGDKPLSTQTRPQFHAARRSAPKTEPGRKRRRRKKQNRRQAFLIGAGIGVGLLLAVVAVLAMDRRGAAEAPPADPAPVADPAGEQADAARDALATAAREQERADAEAQAKRAADREAARAAARKEAADQEARAKEKAEAEAALKEARAAAEAQHEQDADAARIRRERDAERAARKSGGAVANGAGSKGSTEPPMGISDGRTGDDPTPAPQVRLSAEHVPVRRATMGTSKTVTVTVDGPVDTRVTMYWGPAGGPHKTTALEAQGSGVWKGTLTIDAEVASGLEYWIVVKHASATPRVVALGRQSAPHKVAVY